MSFERKLSKNFDFCLSNCPLKESNRKKFDFCWSKRPLKESNQKTLIFACQIDTEHSSVSRDILLCSVSIVIAQGTFE